MPFLTSPFITKRKHLPLPLGVPGVPFEYLLTFGKKAVAFTNHLIPSAKTAEVETISSEDPLLTLCFWVKKNFPSQVFNLSIDEFSKREADVITSQLPSNHRWLPRVEWEWSKKEYFKSVDSSLFASIK